MKKILLCIMDGVGLSKNKKYNAVMAADTPFLDKLWKKYPHSTLAASGVEVGLPRGQMGNSEVGHTNIGAGRIVYQSLEFINSKVRDRSFYDNEEFLKVIRHVKENNSSLHLVGLLSDGGVHSHINHLARLLDMTKNEGLNKVYVHVFTDGRDVSPTSGIKYITMLENYMKKIGLGKIASVGGRYYGMDRDNNFDRVEKAYIAMVTGTKEMPASEIWNSNQKKGITDEFIVPTTVCKDGLIKDNDGIIFFNYRPDRLREMFTAITNPDAVDMDTIKFNNVKLVSMMPINDSVKGITAFDIQKLNNTFGKYVDDLGLNQLRIAETEKYAHVTYFFDGGVELDLKNSKRILVNSPKVATYDLKPEMSAEEVTDKLLNELDKNYLDLVILNYANGDMVGHTGNYEAAVKAVEFLDKCIGRLYQKVAEKNGTLIITADHGNCDVMINEDGTPCTTHTTNKVPFIVTRENISLKEEGKLADIAPTMLDLLNIPIPVEMDGDSLLQ